MKAGIFLAILFSIILMIQESFLHAFGGNIALIPLMIIAGTMVMQRVGVPEGVLWFLLLAALRGDIIAVMYAIIGPMLSIHVFTTRSVYAVIGFGCAVQSIAVLITFIVLPAHVPEHIIAITALFILGLLLGLTMLRTIERSMMHRFLFRVRS